MDPRYTSPDDSEKQDSDPQRFTFRTARSASLTAAILVVVAIETTALHLLLVRRHPIGAWSLTLMSLAVAAWLAADYHAFAQYAIILEDSTLRLSIGRRVTAVIHRNLIASAIVPTWRDIPTASRDYLNAMKPATPNVLLTFREPAPVRLLGVATRPIKQLGMHLDEPARFLAELGTLSA